MSQSHLARLQKLEHELTSSEAHGKKGEALSEAFALFSAETKELLAAHQELKERYETVNRELTETNELLNHKVAELDFVSFYLQSIIDSINQGIIFIDGNGIVTTFNSTAATLLGVSSKHALFHSYWDNFADDFFGIFHAGCDHQSQNPTASSVTIPHEQLQRLLEVNAIFVAKPHSESAVASTLPMPQGLIVLIRDVSEIKRLETVASRNDKMVGEMAAMVAHEIRNPLGGIKGFASLLQRDLKEEPELQRLATYIVEGTDSLNRLVNDILDYSHPMKLHVEATDLVVLMASLSYISMPMKASIRASSCIVIAPPRKYMPLSMPPASNQQ